MLPIAEKNKRYSFSAELSPTSYQAAPPRNRIIAQVKMNFARFFERELVFALEILKESWSASKPFLGDKELFSGALQVPMINLLHP